jgi:hypothetical protein
MKFAVICHPAKFKYNQKICIAKRVGETAQNFRYQGETAKNNAVAGIMKAGPSKLIWTFKETFSFFFLPLL